MFSAQDNKRMAWLSRALVLIMWVPMLLKLFPQFPLYLDPQVNVGNYSVAGSVSRH